MFVAVIVVLSLPFSGFGRCTKKKDKNSTRQNYYVLTMSSSVYDAPNARNVVLTTKFVLISLPRFLRRRRGKYAFKLYRDEKYLGYLFKLLFTQQHSIFFSSFVKKRTFRPLLIFKKVIKGTLTYKRKKDQMKRLSELETHRG